MPAHARQSGLTAEDEVFAQAFVANGGKASEAYRKAWPVRAAKMTCQQVRNAAASKRRAPRMVAYIEALSKPVSKAIAKEFAITVKRIAHELASIAFCDPAELLDPATGDLLPAHQMPEHVRAAISSIDIAVIPNVGIVVKKIRFWDKNQALDKLAKWKKMLIDRVEVGEPGEFDNLSDDEIDAELATFEARDAIARAQKAAKQRPKAVKAREDGGG